MLDIKLLDALKAALLFVSKKSYAGAISGIRMAQVNTGVQAYLTIEATNAQIIMQLKNCSLHQGGADFDMILDAAFVKELSTNCKAVIFKDGHFLKLDRKNVMSEPIKPVLVDGKFPNIDIAVPQAGGDLFPKPFRMNLNYMGLVGKATDLMRGKAYLGAGIVEAFGSESGSIPSAIRISSMQSGSPVFIIAPMRMG